MPDLETRRSKQAPRPRGAVVHVVMPRGWSVRQGGEIVEDDAPFGSAVVAPERSRSADEKLAEAVNLFQAIEVDVVLGEVAALGKINPKLLIGGGKVAELAAKVEELKLDVVMVNAPLSPRQQKSLEEALKAKVLDRTGVILEIFASRARTRAGKLQVELAQLDYQQSRLVRQWSHLERQRGGLGKAGGPGERQLELDRRMLRDRMGLVKRELVEVEQTRGLQRMARQRANIPTVALVGYTNAGKSTLFNTLVSAGTLEADALFATLDPLMRKLKLPGGLEVVLVDTVGFVADLPHELVEAFKATLEEVVMADVLLHVHDLSNAEHEAQAMDVRTVLREIGAADKRMVPVFNKVDRLEAGVVVPKDGFGVSAVTGTGVKELLSGLERLLKADWVRLEVEVPAADGRRLAWLYAHGEVLEKRLDGEMWHLTVHLRGPDVGAWEKLG